MKIGILTSGNDMLSLFSFLQRYDHQYYVWYDDEFLFWGDKPVELLMDRVSKGIDFLKSKGVEKIIVPPMIELKIFDDKLFEGLDIIPLFQKYVLNNCFAYSLVGKIGFLGDWFDIQLGQKQLKNLAKNYVLTENQSNIKKFNFPFAYWAKETRNWKYLLDTCSWSMPLLNNIIKKDLNYFKDAGVDTIIPCNYSYFWVSKAIKKSVYANIKFHGIEVLEKIFIDLVKDESDYGVNVYFTGHCEFLKREKKLIRLLSRGDDKFIKILAA